MESILQHCHIEPVLVDSDIGGTNDTSKYVLMKNFDMVTFIVTLGNTFEGTAANWSTTDDLDEFYLLQATDSAGTGAKAISGATNAQTAVGAPGYQYAITIHASAMDMANSFNYVAAYVAEAGNTAADMVQIIAVRYHSRYKHDDLMVTTNEVHV